MYSTERAKQIIKKDVAFLEAGIIDDVVLSGVRTAVSPNGSRFIEFKFEKDGKTMTHTEWEPKKGPMATDEQFAKKCDNQLARISQILECYHPADQVIFNGSSFAELTSWTVDMYNKGDKAKKLRIKVVYNDNGYTTLPQYAMYTFIEPMSVVIEGKSVIVKLSIDKFEKPIVADKEISNSNPYTVVNGTVDNTNPNDLPF